jgi:hypothetical protein
LNIPSPQSYVPTRVEDWDIPDPAHQPLEVVREIRDQVEQRVTRLIHQGLDEIRSDRTAHQLRLARLLPDLVAEFDGLRTPDEIRACADRSSTTTTRRTSAASSPRSSTSAPVNACAPTSAVLAGR